MGNCQDNPNIINQLGADQSQGHLMNHWKNMPSNSKRRTFQQQLHRTNFRQTLKIYKKSSYSSGKSTSLGSSQQSERTSSTVFTDYRPLLQRHVYSLSAVKNNKKQLDQIGYNVISNGQVAVFIMAASHSTELKIDMPLGIYDIGIDSACGMFDILIYRLLKISKICGLEESKRIKVYIMTSSQNKDIIKQYFKKKQYFQYGSKNVFFFSQPVEPILDEHGKIVLKSEDNIYMGPRGNGCIYQQIKEKKLIQHLENQNIKYCYLCPINNILLKIADPCSLGLLIKEKKDIAAGCFQSNDDCFGYYGMDQKNKVKIYQERIAVEGRKWANTATCWFTLEFLRNVVNDNAFINKITQYSHDIIREATVFNTTLNTLCTQKCLYFQSFYHDAFSLTQKILIFQIQPQEQFAPIKYNGLGKFSLSFAKEELWKWHRKIVENSGIKLVGEGHVQIHPALVYEQMEELNDTIRAKVKGQQLKIPALIV